MNRPKYMIHPGEVVSQFDGEIHYIEFSQLVKLYGVNPDECILADVRRPETLYGLNMNDYIHLYPRSDGKYELPGKEEE